MGSDEISVNLAGPHGEIDPRAIAEAILALDKMIRSVRRDQPALIALSDLSVGSANAGIRTDRARVDVLREGIEELSSSPGIPAGWSVDTVTGLLELHQVGKRAGVTSVELKIDSVVSAVDERLANNATGSIRPSRPVLGSVRGELYRYNGRQRTAALSQSGTAKLVTVTFPAALAGEVRGALDRQVEVWGEVSRDVYDDIESIALTGLDIVEASKTRVALDDVVGLFGAEWTDGLDSVEWVRRQRGC